MDTSILSEFDRHWHKLLHSEEVDEVWQAGLWQYLKDLPSDVSKDTDIIEWWQVHSYFPLPASY